MISSDFPKNVASPTLVLDYFIDLLQDAILQHDLTTGSDGDTKTVKYRVPILTWTHLRGYKGVDSDMEFSKTESGFQADFYLLICKCMNLQDRRVSFPILDIV